MMCQIYSLLEMVCTIIFVLGLVKSVHLCTLIYIKFLEIDKLRKKGFNENESKK